MNPDVNFFEGDDESIRAVDRLTAGQRTGKSMENAAHIIAGSTGMGKSTLARIMSKKYGHKTITQADLDKAGPVKSSKYEFVVAENVMTDAVDVVVEASSTFSDPRRIAFSIERDQIKDWKIQDCLDKGLTASETEELMVYLIHILEREREDDGTYLTAP